jgi:nicotinamide riboside kinase
MIRIGFSGVPGSGKTSCTRALALQLKNVEVVSEYARRYISKHGPITSIFEQYRVMQKQREWEDSVCNEKLKYMITDSPIFLGFIYSSMLPKTNSKEILFFNDVFKEMTKINNPIHRYDLIIHLPPIKQPSDDGVRSPQQFEDKWREENNNLILSTYHIFPPKKLHIMDLESYDIDDIVTKSVTLINKL